MNAKIEFLKFKFLEKSKALTFKSALKLKNVMGKRKKYLLDVPDHVVLIQCVGDEVDAPQTGVLR
jgi:hypothetical protein